MNQKTATTADWIATVSKNKTNKNFMNIRRPWRSSPVKIWRSRLSWRIALAVFMTILLVQTTILNFNLTKVEQEELEELTELAKSSITPLIDTRVTDLFASPISDQDINRLLTTTRVLGLAIYSADLNLIATAGEPTSLVILDRENLNKTHRSANGEVYEVVLRPNDLRRPYVMTTRLDASAVQEKVTTYVQETILIMMLMSALVTTVLMIALGRWLLEPILFMRDNLQAASTNPENPDIPVSPYDKGDEIGGAIDIAQRLIRQNSENLQRIKSAAEDKIHKLAYYDTLTGLPNRSLFLQTIADKIRQVDPANTDVQRFAVVAMDLDHFKDINDSMGHNIGDAILRSIGKRLRSALPESAMVSRMGQDEFAVTMPLSSDLNSSRDLADKLHHVIRAEPFKVFNEEFQVRASIGVSTYPDDGVDPDQVLKNADIALNRAKEEGRDKIKEYSEDFDRAVQQRFQMLRDLRDAMEQKQLTMHFQPQLDLKSGKVIGAEALIRWWKPDNSKDGGSFIPPFDFIPIAEQSGLIVPIGEWVMKFACEHAASWQKDLGKDLRIAVNVSAAQFHQSDICDYVQKVLKDTGLQPHNLELEVTESVFMDDIEHTIETLKSLHSMGVELAIDDFGTGYSSLSYLRQFPIDRLKIDQSFIRNALNDNDDASIARTIVRLGHSLNLKVIAEGVETKDHEKFLIDEGCDEVQGYRYSKPVPAEDFVSFVKNYNGKLESFDV